MNPTNISTHVLDTALGKPAAGIKVILEAFASDLEILILARGETDADGRIASLLPWSSLTGQHRLRFATGDYFRATGQAVFYPEVIVNVNLEAGMKYHIPLLLSPFGYSTYLGS